MEKSKEREIENSDISPLEQGAMIGAGSILNALGGFFTMTGVSTLQSSWSGVGVFTDERKAFGTNTHKLQEMGWLSRAGGALVSSIPLLAGLGLMASGSMLVDFGRSKKLRMINLYTSDDLEGDEAIGANPDLGDLQDNTPDIEEVMEDEGNTQFHSEKELSDIRLDELDLPNDFTEYLAVEGYEFASDLPDLKEATLANEIDITADQAHELNKAVVMEL